MESIVGSRKDAQKLVQRARSKVTDENNVRAMMTTALNDWMKKTTKQDDKVDSFYILRVKTF